MKDLTKEERIKEELTRISAYCEGVDANQKASIAPLLQNAAFMKVTLEDLQDIINAEGVTEVYQNGANQKGVKQSAELQSYNSLIKNYASVIKTISQLLPPEKRKANIFTLPREKTEEEKEAEREETQKNADYWAEQARLLRENVEKKDREKKII